MGWSQTTIGDQVLLQRGIDITKATQRPGSVPVISSGGVSSSHDLAAAPGPGVVLGRKGVVGSVWYVETDYWPHDTTLWVKDFKGNHPRFVYYFFKAMAPRLASLDVGSANPTLNRNHVHPTEVLWPSTAEQRAIASVLGILDDKIQQNERLNETLEETARSFFKSWFVDFDPVRAKAAGRQPSAMNSETAALFPSCLVESEAGEVPEKWTVRPVYELASYINGAAYRDFHFCPPSDGLPIVKIAELKAGVTGQTKFTNTTLDERYRIDTGDMLFSWSGNPDTSIDTFIWTRGPAWLNQHIFKVVPRKANERLFVFRLLRHLRPVFAETARNKQTTGLGHVTAGDMKRLMVAVPPEALLDAFERFIGPLHARWFGNLLESQTLAELRDLLLPKLILGELRIPTAEKMVEAAL